MKSAYQEKPCYSRKKGGRTARGLYCRCYFVGLDWGSPSLTDDLLRNAKRQALYGHILLKTKTKERERDTLAPRRREWCSG